MLETKMVHFFDSQCTGWRKKGTILSHCKYSENTMTELHGNWSRTSAILYAEHSH